MIAGHREFALVLVVLLSCDGNGAATGAERGPCYGNGTCNDGLTCLSDTCVYLPDAASADAEPQDANIPLDAEPLDATRIVCNDDSAIEPNDTTSSAWVTPIPATMPSVSLVQLAICPTTDMDLYRFGIEVTGKNMKATVTVADVSIDPLLVQVFNAGGATIANGQAAGQTEFVVAVNNFAVGTYYVQVSAGSAGVRNNYTLDIVTCDGAPCS